jgi:hypothetical protein
MKFYKLSQRMFDTYGMEDILFDAFKRHHQIASKNSWSFNQMLRGGQAVQLGKMRIGHLLDKIIEKHGPPLTKDYPRTVIFGIIPHNHKWAKGQDARAFFWQDKKGNLYILRVADALQYIEFDDSLKRTLQHEFQHLLLHMYNPNAIQEGGKEALQSGTLAYYSKAMEIQALCAGLARSAFKAWTDMTEYGFRKWTPEHILSKIPEWRNSIDHYFKIFVLNSFMGAFKQFDESRDKIISQNPELKRKYLDYTYRNFVSMCNRYLDELTVKMQEKQLSEAL